MPLQTAWLTCKISEGMLPDEVAVVCSSADRGDFSFFAPQELIDSTRTKVRVEVVDSDDHHYLVFLPVTPFENLNRTVKVEKDVVLI